MEPTTIKTGILYREFSFTRDNVNEEERTVKLSFSSEEPIERFWGKEILDHGKKSVMLDRINNGGAFLMDHDTRDQIGVVEKAYIGSDKKGRALVRYSKSGRANEIFTDVLDGIRSNISVGYRIHKMKQEDSDPDNPTFRATRWEPMEISMVSVPADVSVGVGRSQTENHLTTIERDIIMADDKKKNETPAITPDQNRADPPEIKLVQPAEEDLTKIRQDAAREAGEAERIRQRDIMFIGEKFNLRDDAQRAIANDTSADAFRESVLNRIADKDPVLVPDANIGLTESETRQYSFTRALRMLVFANEPKFREEGAFEIECSKAAAAQRGIQPKGLLVPNDVLLANGYMGARTLTAGTATDGAELVADNLMAGSFIDVLRNLAVVMQMGARTLTGLTGDILIPRKTSGSAAGWISSEGGDVSLSEAQFDQVSLTPKTLGAYSQISRQLLLQSSLDVEALIRDDLAQAVAIEIDRAALYGSGASGQPTGISQQSGINTPTNFAAAVPTWAEVVAMESAVAVDNALMGQLGYIIEPSMRGSLKTTEKASGTAVFIYGPGETLNGYNCGVSSQITSGDVFFGNLNDLIVAFWGGLDVLVDPYTNSLSGTIRIVVHESVDVAVRHPVSFALNNDGV